MKYIHVRNLEKYQPGYKDRSLIWAKIYLSMVQGDEETEMLGEIEFSRLVKLIVMETCRGKQTPADERFLSKRNWDFGIQSLSSTLNLLSHFIEVTDVTENGDSVTDSLPRVEKSREDKSREEKVITSPKELFLAFRESVKNLPQPREFTRDRESKCRVRLRERALSEWILIFERMDKTPFLLGDNDRGWVASFDWIIANETNAAKVLEGKYDKLKTAHNLNKTQVKQMEALRDFTERKGPVRPENLRAGDGHAVISLPGDKF